MARNKQPRVPKEQKAKTLLITMLVFKKKKRKRKLKTHGKHRFVGLRNCGFLDCFGGGPVGKRCDRLIDMD